MINSKAKINTLYFDHGKTEEIFSTLIQATRTTESWIISSGLHSGIGELVGSALHEYQLIRRGRIRAVGIAPWGIVDNREDLKHQGKSFFGLFSEPKI